MKEETKKFLTRDYKGEEEKEALLRIIVDRPIYDEEKHSEYSPEDFEMVPLNVSDPRCTNRGFALNEFKDLYGSPCSIQKSSLATDHSIWFGIDDAQPKILVPGKSWQPFPIPDDVMLNTRMHLNREQVMELLPALIKFAETGEL